MVSPPRRDPIDKIYNIKDARRARRQRIRELMNRPTTIYIDRNIIPEEIIEALENRLEPNVRVALSPIDNGNGFNIEDNFDENSDSESDSSSDSDSSNSYVVNENNSLVADSPESLSLSDFEEWEARAEIIQPEEHYNSQDDSAHEDTSIEFSSSPSPLFVLPNDEEDEEDLISRLLRDISDDQLLNMFEDINCSFLKEDLL